MEIIIDGKKCTVSDSAQNIVDVARENGITISAPCYSNNRKGGCCKVCLVSINGEHRYACGEKPYDGMEVIYKNSELEAIRKDNLMRYISNVRSGKSSDCECKCSC